MSWSSGIPLPGEEEARELGYTLCYHAGNHTRANYSKDGIHLEVWYSSEGLMALLSYIHRGFIVSGFGTGFQFPPPGFAGFERTIQDIKRAIELMEQLGESV